MSNEDQIILIRHNLGSIDPSDYEEEMTVDERKEFVSIIASSYKTTARVISDLIEIQKDFAIKESRTWEEVIFARGTINGLSLLAEKLNLYKDEHIQNVIDAQGKN